MPEVQVVAALAGVISATTRLVYVTLLIMPLSPRAASLQVTVTPFFVDR